MKTGALCCIIREIKGTVVEDRFYPDEMFDAVEKAYNHLTFTHEDMLELAEQRERSNRILQRYNDFYNKECASLPTGGPISMENLQAITLECMVDALICENMNVEYNVIAIDDIKDLIARLYQQSDEFLERVRKNNE